MSEFCGLLARAEVPANIAEAKVEAMLDAYGRTHATCRTVTPAPQLYLGFASLNAFHHEVPRRGQVTARDNLVVFGDISLWHRDDTPSPDTDDVAYLHKHLRRGRGLDRVNGNFCGGAYDETSTTLTLFRDQIGTCTVYYTHQEEGLWFASNLRFFHGLCATKETIDPLSLAAYSVMLHPGQGRTYFKNVHQVIAAHQVQVSAGHHLNETRYWSLETSKNHGLKDVGQAVAHIREKLERAVTGRIADTPNPGTALSGGLDSTTVTALVAKFRAGPETHCFSHRAPNPDDPNPEWSDWPYMQDAVREIPGLRHHVVSSAHIDVLAGTDYYFQRALIPSNDLFFHGTQAIYEAAIEAGVNVCLDGMFGDFAFSLTADPILLQALFRGNVSLFLQEYRRRLADYDGRSRLFWRQEFLRPMIPAAFLKIRQRRQGRHWTQSSPLRQTWIKSTALQGLLKSNLYENPAAPRLSIAKTLSDEIQYPWVPQLAVHQDYVNGDHGVRIRNPLADIDLLEALYWAPYTAFASPTHDRSIARRVAQDLLPPSILSRETKDEFTPSVFHRLIESMDKIEHALTDTKDLMSDLYDYDQLQRQISGIRKRNEISHSEFFDVLLPHATGQFLTNFA